ncbi:hypothetical protein HMPREF0556_11756 [Listeria grayi DSM 20601]|uniref:Uncharacterized protein n=1 Tax=Listeria grayi DSM 20601 TaxID=525367 RepID=D7V0H8_LISGR|nr:hypothetical protein HMPREF0556_11756 [Listeria grayi DSM 20601]
MIGAGCVVLVLDVMGVIPMLVIHKKAISFKYMSNDTAFPIFSL